MKVVSAVSPEVAQRNAEAAAFFREFADRFERGEVIDCVMVWSDLSEKAYGSWGDYKDKWRMLGALEFAKAGVANGWGL